MSKKEKILDYLVQNSNNKGEINKPQIDICKEIGVTDTYIRTVFRQLMSDGIIEKQGKKIILLDKNKQVIDNITTNLDYSDREKELLQYIYNMYENRDKNFDYICISRDNISKNTSIKNGSHITDYINKYISDGLIEMIKGDYKKKQASKFKFIYNPKVIVDNKQTTIDNSNNNGVVNNIQNQYNNIDVSELVNLIKEQNNLIREQNKQIADLKESLQYHVGRYNKVIDDVADMIINYIDEVRSDVDTMYQVQNIQMPKPDRKCTIAEIRKYLDKE